MVEFNQSPVQGILNMRIFSKCVFFVNFNVTKIINEITWKVNIASLVGIFCKLKVLPVLKSCEPNRNLKQFI